MACFGFHVPCPCFQGDGGGGGGGGERLFLSILYKVAIMMDDFDPPPPPPKKVKNGKMAYFGLLAGFSYFFDCVIRIRGFSLAS